MNGKQWTLFFIVLLSLDNVMATFWWHRTDSSDDDSYGDSNTDYGNYDDWNRCSPQLRSRLDTGLGSIRSRLNGLCPLRNRNIERYSLKNVRGKGFNKFKRVGPCHCKPGRGSDLLHFTISFEEIITSFELTGASLGKSGDFTSHIKRIFGYFTSKLIKILFPEVLVDIVLSIQESVSVRDFRVLESRGNKVSFLTEAFQSHERLFELYFRNALRIVIKMFLENTFKFDFESLIQELTFSENLFQNSGRQWSRDDETDSEMSGGEFSGRSGGKDKSRRSRSNGGDDSGTEREGENGGRYDRRNKFSRGRSNRGGEFKTKREREDEVGNERGHKSRGGRSNRGAESRPEREKEDGGGYDREQGASNTGRQSSNSDNVEEEYEPWQSRVESKTEYDGGESVDSQESGEDFESGSNSENDTSYETENNTDSESDFDEK